MSSGQASSPYPISPLEQHEIPAFFELDAAAFGIRMSQGVRDLLESIMNTQRISVSRDGAELVGSAASDTSLMTVPGLGQVTTAMVAGVSVVPTHRRQGRLNALMRHQLDEIHSYGEPIASLYASEGGIYGRYGYGQATFGSAYVLDKRTAKLARPASEFGDGRVRLITREQASEVFPAVYAEFVTLRAGEFERSQLEYLGALGEPGSEELSRRWYAVYESSGRIDGYVAYEVEALEPGGRERGVRVHELCTLNDASYVFLWQYLLGIDLTTELRAPNRPVDEPIRWLLTNARELRTERSGERTWVRLVDVAAALAARRYPEAGQLVIGVTDDFCPWNTGTYALAVTQEWEAGEVTATSAPADIELDVAALASMYLGGVPATSLAAVGRVKAADRAAIAKATRMFANEVPPYCLTHF
ncbi:MAG TPA: GNAT family N-acetyltransferase [Acidimicrobiales bacterium]|nr:GNAT family N-acetyltransferase [Acidimicrobiales bacterium]